jgi:hypothetical protein
MQQIAIFPNMNVFLSLFAKKPWYANNASLNKHLLYKESALCKGELLLEFCDNSIFEHIIIVRQNN